MHMLFQPFFILTENSFSFNERISRQVTLLQRNYCGCKLMWECECLALFPEILHNSQETRGSLTTATGC